MPVILGSNPGQICIEFNIFERKICTQARIWILDLQLYALDNGSGTNFSLKYININPSGPSFTYIALNFSNYQNFSLTLTKDDMWMGRISVLLPCFRGLSPVEKSWKFLSEIVLTNHIPYLFKEALHAFRYLLAFILSTFYF